MVKNQLILFKDDIGWFFSKDTLERHSEVFYMVKRILINYFLYI